MRHMQIVYHRRLAPPGTGFNYYTGHRVLRGCCASMGTLMADSWTIGFVRDTDPLNPECPTRNGLALIDHHETTSYLPQTGMVEGFLKYCPFCGEEIEVIEEP